MAVDPAVASLIAREIFEGAMFITTHCGAVSKSKILSDEEKQGYLRQLGLGVAAGFLCGVIISIATGFAMAAALSQAEDAEYGVEVGEGISKLIAGIFVFDMALKIPKWFGISNYVERHEEKIKITDKTVLSTSLFWNILRETSEAGVITGLTVLLSPNGLDTLGASVGVGICAAVVGGGGLSLGAAYLNAYFFGGFATIITMILDAGLIVGAVSAFEEACDLKYGLMSDKLYEAEGNDKTILQATAWSAVRQELTVATLVAWIFMVVLLIFVQVWQNYLGYDFLPACIRESKYFYGRSRTDSVESEKNSEEDNDIKKPSNDDIENGAVDNSHKSAGACTKPFVANNSVESTDL